MSFETWTPDATEAKYANGVGLDPRDLSNMSDAVDAAGNIILGADSILALLNKTPGFPQGLTIDTPQINSNNSTDGYLIEWNGETRQFLTIGKGILNVGRLLYSMYGPNPVNGGGVGNPGAFSCTQSGFPLGMPFWVPTPVVATAPAAPAAPVPLPTPIPAFPGFGSPTVATPTPTLASLLAELQALLPPKS